MVLWQQNFSILFWRCGFTFYNSVQEVLQNRRFFRLGVEIRLWSYHLCSRCERVILVLCNSISVDRSDMAASRFLSAAAACVVLSSFAAQSCKSYCCVCLVVSLHQSLPDRFQNLLRNPVEPDLATRQSLPDLLRNLLRTFSGTFSGTLLNLTWLCTKASHIFSGTFSGTLLNVTWLCTKASQTFSGTFGTFVEPDPAPAPVHTGAILG